MGFVIGRSLPVRSAAPRIEWKLPNGQIIEKYFDFWRRPLVLVEPCRHFGDVDSRHHGIRQRSSDHCGAWLFLHHGEERRGVQNNSAQHLLLSSRSTTCSDKLVNCADRLLASNSTKAPQRRLDGFLPGGIILRHWLAGAYLDDVWFHGSAGHGSRRRNAARRSVPLGRLGKADQWVSRIGLEQFVHFTVSGCLRQAVSDDQEIPTP